MYLYGDRKLVCQCLRFSSVSWKGAPSTKENRICGSVNCCVECKVVCTFTFFVQVRCVRKDVTLLPKNINEIHFWMWDIDFMSALMGLYMCMFGWFAMNINVCLCRIQWNLFIMRSLGPWKLPGYIRFLVKSG